MTNFEIPIEMAKHVRRVASELDISADEVVRQSIETFIGGRDMTEQRRKQDDAWNMAKRLQVTDKQRANWARLRADSDEVIPGR